VVFRANFCDRRTMTQEFTLTNPGGGQVDFTLDPQARGVVVSPSYGSRRHHPRQRRPGGLQNQRGTFKTDIKIHSASASTWSLRCAYW